MPGIFGLKFFNAEVFGKYVDTIPRIKQNAFLSAGVLRTRNELKSMLTDQTGGNFITVPMSGRIGGEPDNYDGNTDISEGEIGTYNQSMIVVGRAKGWKEQDFTYDITGKDFMEVIGQQISDYWDDVDQATILAVLAGIFGVSDANFNTAHTYDISANEGDAALAGPDSLNNAIQQAAGANKNIFTMAIMHSAVATHLENLELLEYRKQTDGNGIQRRIALADWNGRTVLIDDDVPVEQVEASGSNPAYTKYTTYLLGQGAFDYCNVGAKVPYEPDRDPKTKGGIDKLYTRQRKIFAPYGFTFKQPSTPIISPTNTQLSTAARWGLVRDTAGTGFIDPKAIPIARIISKG